METRLKDLKKEMNESLFNEHTHYSRKAAIFEAIGKESSKHGIVTLRYTLNGLLTLLLVIAGAYFSYINYFQKNELSHQSLKSVQGEAAKEEVREEIKYKWSHPFNYIHTVRGSYTYENQVDNISNKVQYVLKNEEGKFKFIFKTNNWTHIYQDNNPFDTRHNLLRIDGNTKSFEINGLAVSTEKYVEEFLRIRPMFSRNFPYQLFTNNFTWEHIATSELFNRNVYSIKAIRTKEEKGRYSSISRYSLVIDQETGYIIKLDAFTKYDKKIISFDTDELVLNKEISDKTFSYKIPEGYGPVNENSAAFQKRLEKE